MTATTGMVWRSAPFRERMEDMRLPPVGLLAMPLACLLLAAGCGGSGAVEPTLDITPRSEPTRLSFCRQN